MAARQLQKRAAVLRDGIQLYVRVTDVCPTRVSIAQQQLVRLQLHIRLLNDTCLHAASLAFVHSSYTNLKGKYIRIRFLPGDLSHVVVII
jgi:hypothetical protein